MERGIIVLLNRHIVHRGVWVLDELRTHAEGGRKCAMAEKGVQTHWQLGLVTVKN